MNGNTLRTGKCLHCGKTLGRHKKAFLQKPGEPTQTWQPYYCPNHPSSFYDSGLAALDAHKEELYLALVGYFDGLDNCDIDKERVYEMELRSILNQIEKEK